MRTTILYFLILLLAGCAFGFVAGSPAFEHFQEGNPLSLNYKNYYSNGTLTPAQAAWMVATSAFVLSLAFILWLFEVVRGRRVDSTIEHRRRQARRRYYHRRAERRRKAKEQANV